MRERRQLRTHLALPLAALLGAGAVVLPAIAVSETGPTVNAESSTAVCGSLYPNCWSPAQVSVESAGGTVLFKNESGVAHGIVWTSVPATPACSGVPVGSASTSFSGSCTFATPGTYSFYCYVHGPSMSGTVTVNASGTTTVNTTTQTAPTQTSSTSPPAPPPPTTAGEGAYGPSSSSGGPSGAAAALEAASLASHQRGGSVRMSLTIGPSGAGARLEVDLFAPAAALAGAAHPAQVRVGRLVRAGLPAGRLNVSVALSPRARAALRRHRQISLRVKIVVAAPGAAAQSISRRVTLRG